MKRTTSELRSAFGAKIGHLEKLLSMAKQEALLSEQRNEIVSSIAVILRALFCKDGNGDPLINSSLLTNDFVFPFRNALEVYNELKSTFLVEYKIDGDKCCFTSSSMSADLVPANYLSYYGWIYEAVIDFKKAGYPPLSREEVIKTIADKNGAHFDTSLDKYSACLISKEIVFLDINIDGRSCFFDCRNLLFETVLSIAEEVVFSYKYLRKPELTLPSPSQFVLNLFDYSDLKWRRYKYSICSPVVNKYNTNQFYSCEITTHPLTTYNLKFRDRPFRVGFVRIEDIMA